MNSFFTCSLICIFSFSLSPLSARQNHFIYIQSETNVSFYIKLDNKVHSSTASGYIILPKLSSGEYSLLIGFPKDQWPEQKLTVAVNSKDEGFLLKNFGDKGWGLFNLRNQEVIMSSQETVIENQPLREIKNDLFSNTLADVVNDSSIKQTDIARIDPPVQLVENPEMKTQDKQIEQSDSAVVTIIEKPVEIIPVNKVSKEPLTDNIIDTASVVVNSPRVRQLLAKTSNDGIDLIYIDESEDVPDTVRLFVGGQRLSKKEEARLLKLNEAKFSEDKLLEDRALELTVMGAKAAEDSLNLLLQKVDNISPTDIAKDNVLENLNKDSARQNPVTAVQQPVFIEDKIQKPLNEGSAASMINSDCKKVASDEDYLKLRKKLAAETTNGDMVDAARKFFKTRCFTTEQIKNLSGLFVNDEGKYQFFDAAYAFLYDTDNFSSLEVLLSDSYYINRFRAMIKK